MSFKQALVDHLCHRIFPWSIILFLLFAKFSFTSWQPYVIVGLLIFIQRYNFKLGYYANILENGAINYEKESEVEE